MEKVRANLCFDSSEHRLQTADDKNKVTSEILRKVNIFQLVLYFDSTVINNQISYYFKPDSQVAEKSCQIKVFFNLVRKNTNTYLVGVTMRINGF